MKRAGVIGAGIAGLAAAVRLVNKGYQVDVFEANAYPGGKLSEINCQGYRFDAGPSLFTLPELVEELFTLAGENPEEHFRYIRLPVNCHYFYEDGTFLRAFADREKFLQEVGAKTQESPERKTSFGSKCPFIQYPLGFIYEAIPASMADICKFEGTTGLQATAPPGFFSQHASGQRAVLQG
jgi:phytoene dehydrogenase-like protein